MKFFKKKFISFLSFLLFLLQIDSAYAFEIPSLDKMAENLANNLDPVINMLVAVAFVMGIFFVVMGVYGMKKSGESQASAYGKAVAGPLLKVLIGSALIFLPSIIEVSRWTLWGAGHESPIFKYQTQKGDIWEPVITVTILLIKILGFVSLVRGFVMLNHMATQMQQSMTGKAVTFIVGGILAINIVGVVKVIGNTLGFVYS